MTVNDLGGRIGLDWNLTVLKDLAMERAAGSTAWQWALAHQVNSQPQGWDMACWSAGRQEDCCKEQAFVYVA